ncbi:MAG: sugar ABC transporter permease [Armatimonadetes bacterium]|nr:sugar ABC transporter permease [Armatimonadota bacterium]
MTLSKEARRTIVAYLFLSPALLFLLVFTFYPTIWGILLSFFDYNMLRTLDDGTLAPPVFVGVSNFERIFRDPYFYIALKNSLLYLLVVPVIQLLSIGLAMAVNRPMRLITFFRASYYVPVITSIVVVGISWKWLFRSDGLINVLLQKTPLLHGSVGWLTDRNIALFSVMFVTLWQGLGYYMVLYLAGLQSIPAEYEEAARLDGASPFRVFAKITLPLLKPTVALCSIISCISALKVFGEIYVMTEGGPEYSTLTLVYYIFGKAFNEFQMGYASALAAVLAVFVGRGKNYDRQSDALYRYCR